MIRAFGRFRAALKNPRWRIVITALFLGAFCGTFEVTLPLNDMFVAARTKMRHASASGDIVVVKLDDRTAEVLGGNDVNPGLDAELIEYLIENGAKSVYFARKYPFTIRSTGAPYLTEVLKKYPGQVYFGAAAKPGEGVRPVLEVGTAKEFRKHAADVSLAVRRHPMNLDFDFPVATPSEVGPVPSISASMADYKTTKSESYVKPNFAIDYRTIPAVSYIDVINGQLDPAAIKGRTFVVGLTSSMAELRPIPWGDFVPGVYFHVIAAETIKQGISLDLDWLPAYLAVAALLVIGMSRGLSIKLLHVAGFGLLIIALPFVLDRFDTRIDVLPAVVMAIYVIFRVHALDKIKGVSETNAASGLPSFQALRRSEERADGLVVALKVRNYAGIIRSFAEPVEAQMAVEIQRRIRISEPNVVVYHEGGLFVWMSNLTDIVELFENLEGLHRIVQNGIVLAGTEVDVGFNCGVDSNQNEALSHRLANALQSAEEAVRSDEIVCHHDGVKGEVQWEISLLASLDRAIDNGEVWVAFQPKLDLATQRIIGAEALARWTHPERGPISPEKFIGIAEEYHRIERITRFVLDRAVSAAAQLVRDGHDFSVSVNISAQLLRNARLPQMIFEALGAHDLPAKHLILEITETDRFERSARTIDMMKGLVASGLRISIDDFGTGNATIDYLRYMPAAEVKIDKIFIKEIESNSGDHLLVQSIIEMAHSLGRQVVAEGVETAETIAVLEKLKCDQVQGYHVGRPVPFGDFLDRILRVQTVQTG